MLYRTLIFPYATLARGLAQLERLTRWPAPGSSARAMHQSRSELEQMSERDLNDLGISRSDIAPLIDDPVRWRQDRR